MGRVIYLNVTMAISTATARERAQSRIVVRVLRLICPMQSLSGMATTISQSSPRASVRGVTSNELKLVLLGSKHSGIVTHCIDTLAIL